VTAAYVDTSWLVAIAFGESGATHATRRLHGVSSNLLEADRQAHVAERLGFVVART
jgi:uncharacterized protein with PIN domain